MYRAPRVGSKACAEKDRQREDERLRNRIKTMKPTVDTTEPHAIHMDHIRNNLKREQMMEDRYHEIDRANRILLNKMSEMMKTPKGQARPRTGPTSMTRDGRKQELQRITKENHHLLRRIQQTQPVYNHVNWEEDFKRNTYFLKNATEFPLVLKRKAMSRSTGSLGAGLTPMGNTGAAGATGVSRTESRAGLGETGAARSDELRFVLKEGAQIGEQVYLLEMATDGRILAITAYDGAKQKSLELIVNEANHRRLFREANGDYSLISQKLYIDGDRLEIDLSGGPLDPRGRTLPKKPDGTMAKTA